MVGADDPPGFPRGGTRLRIAEHHINVIKDGGADRGFGRRHAGDGIEAFFREELADFLPAPLQGEDAAISFIIGARGRLHTLKDNLIAPNFDGLTGGHELDALFRAGCDADHTEDEHTDARMGDGRAPRGARKAFEAVETFRKRDTPDACALGEINHRTGHKPCGQGKAEGGEHRRAFHHEQGDEPDREGDDGSRVETLGRRHGVCPLPGQHGAEGDEHQERQDDGGEGRVEEGRADGDLFPGYPLKHQRIKGADEDSGRRGGEQQIVHYQRRLTADRREEPAQLEGGRAPCIERKRTADEEDQNTENEQASLRVDGEGMHRGQHT